MGCSIRRIKKNHSYWYNNQTFPSANINDGTAGRNSLVSLPDPSEILGLSTQAEQLASQNDHTACKLAVHTHQARRAAQSASSQRSVLNRKRRVEVIDLEASGSELHESEEHDDAEEESE